MPDLLPVGEVPKSQELFVPSSNITITKFFNVFHDSGFATLSNNIEKLSPVLPLLSQCNCIKNHFPSGLALALVD